MTNDAWLVANEARTPLVTATHQNSTVCVILGSANWNDNQIKEEYPRNGN